MKPTDTTSTAHHPDLWHADWQGRSVLRFVAAMLLGYGVLTTLSRIDEASGMFLPFVWRDLAAVHLLAAWPLAGELLVRLKRAGVKAEGRGTRDEGRSRRQSHRIESFPPLAPRPLALAPLIAAVSALPAAAWLAGIDAQSFVGGGLLRALIAGLVMLFARGVVDLTVDWLLPPHSHGMHARSRLAATVAALVAVVLPTAYAFQRAEQSLARLEESLAGQRLGTADRLARQVLAVRPDAQAGGRSLLYTSRQMTRSLRSIQQELASHDPGALTLDERLRRARLLAISGRSEEAIRTAKRLVSRPAVAASACLLLGTLYEELRDWPESRRWYAEARDRLTDRPEPTAGLVRAWKGIAFAQRKAGHYAAAESAYRQTLRLSPTADIHFLMAQFYEDTQRSHEAWYHAQAAMRLDPRGYSARGAALRDQLVMHHTGCLSIYRSARQPSEQNVGADP